MRNVNINIIRTPANCLQYSYRLFAPAGAMPASISSAPLEPLIRHFIAVVINDAPNLHAVHIVHQTALVLHLGHAVDRVKVTTSLSSMPALEAGFSSTLVCFALPSQLSVSALMVMSSFTSAPPTSEAALNLVWSEHLCRSRSLGVRTIHRILDLCTPRYPRTARCTALP